MKEEGYAKEQLAVKYESQKKVIDELHKSIDQKNEQIERLVRGLNEGMRYRTAAEDGIEKECCRVHRSRISVLESEVSNKNIELEAISEALSVARKESGDFRQSVMQKFSTLLDGRLEELLSTRLAALTTHIRDREKEFEETKNKLKQKELQLELMMVDVRR